MPTFVDRAGRAPYIADDTRQWVEQFRENGLLKPQCLLRIATDTNYIHNSRADLYENRHAPGGQTLQNAKTKCMMNVALPGMHIPGILNWQVTEQLDNVVQTASFEALNALPLSETTTRLSEDLAGVLYGKTVPGDALTLTSTWAQDSIGVTRRATGGNTGRPGNNNIEMYRDNQGAFYQEKNVKYRTFANQVMSVEDTSRFPDPRIPDDDDNDVADDANWPDSPTGQGSFFVLIGREVIRVVGYAQDTDGTKSPAANPTNHFIIPPGGRKVNGIMEEHHRGDTVTLLGYGPYSGDWCAMGYLNVDDYAPQTSTLRPGTCLVSYEGYGDIKGPLSHDFDENRNYQFTGYWFITTVEPSLTEDGVPKIKVSLKGTGYMFDKQKITPDLTRRVKNQFDQWHIGQVYGEASGETIWGAADHSRDIPGDWVDYNSWDPTLPGAYPLKIQTELAQHKAFFQHMTETNFGRECEICMKEHTEWLKTHKAGKSHVWQENRSVGKHIYKESIRVEHPIKTYIRLMATIAAASWDHPALGTELVQRFTKIPNKLFDNIRNVQTGLVYNGQLVYDKFVNEALDKQFDWFNPTYDDTKVLSHRNKISCPFDTTYDQAPFWQPMQDLADLNGAVITVTRQGYPVFVPRLFPLRPSGTGYKTLNTKTGPILPAERSSWNLSYGGSISAYSPSVDADSMITQCWVRANTAFDGTTIQVITGGTGFAGGSRVFYSGLGGNKEGLMFTSGVQQVDQFEIPNLVLGLDWDTHTRAKGQTGWGARFTDKDGDTVIAVNPPFYEGSIEISTATKGYSEAKKQIQRTVNFFIAREIVAPFKVGINWVYALDVSGDFGTKTEEGVKQLQRFVGRTADGKWTQGLYKALKGYIDKNAEFLKFDPMWYVKQPLGWSYFLSAVTGAPIVGSKKKSNISPLLGKTFVPDQQASQKAEGEWVKQFSKMVINIGSRRVDEALDKATARTVSTNIADPRIQLGDVAWVHVPGFIEAVNSRGNLLPPFNNGVYITSINRQIDLEGNGGYTATYSGYRYRGDFATNLNRKSINVGWDFYADG